MFPNENAQDRLAHAYEEMEDEALLRMMVQPEQLTDKARALAFAEVRRRRLTLPVAAPAPARRVEDEVDPPTSAGEPLRKRELWYARPGDYAELAPPDCIIPMPDDPHAIRVALALADIPYDEFWPSAKIDLREPFLAVRPEDRERA